VEEKESRFSERKKKRKKTPLKTVFLAGKRQMISLRREKKIKALSPYTAKGKEKRSLLPFREEEKRGHHEGNCNEEKGGRREASHLSGWEKGKIIITSPSYVGKKNEVSERHC